MSGAGDNLVDRLRRDFTVKKGDVVWRRRDPSRFADAAEPEALCGSFNTRYAGKPAGKIKRGKRIVVFEGRTWRLVDLVETLKTGVLPPAFDPESPDGPDGPAGPSGDAIGDGPLARVFAEALVSSGLSTADLTVLDPKADPFRLISPRRGCNSPTAASHRSFSPTTQSNPMTDAKRPRNIANDILDAVETATSKWTRQKKSEKRHPGNIRYRVSRMTRTPRTSQKDAAWGVMEACYLKASANNTLPASARQIYYQARPRIMALTDEKAFSQTLLPDYIGEHAVDWDVVYDMRGHFQEPHTNRKIGCGTIEVRNYLNAASAPKIAPADFASAGVDVIGPAGNIAAVLYCEKEGFGPLFRAVNLADRYDLMIVSSKGVSVTAARKLIDEVCVDNDLPLFVLHDFDVAGFLIAATLKRDTRRFQFSNIVEVVDLGLRLADIEGLEREPAAATKTGAHLLRDQLAENGATEAEIEILLDERAELNAMTSDALVAMIETKLRAYGLQKVVPDDDTLAKTYCAFHRSERLREKFEELAEVFDGEADEVAVPKDLRTHVEAILAEHDDLRWDDAVQLVLDGTSLDRVLAEKQKAKKKSGDFTGEDDVDDDDD
jgi:hypothetical protein